MSKESTRPVSVRIADEEHAAIKNYCELYGAKQSPLIRSAITMLLNSTEQVDLSREVGKGTFVSARLPETTIRKLDAYAEAHGTDDRSPVIRAAIRMKLSLN